MLHLHNNMRYKYIVWQYAPKAIIIILLDNELNTINLLTNDQCTIVHCTMKTYQREHG